MQWQISICCELKINVYGGKLKEAYIISIDLSFFK